MAKTETSLAVKGQDVACKFLRHLGFSILEENYSCAAGSMDLIAQDEDGTIHFIAIKTQMSNGDGFPRSKPKTAKQRQKSESIAEMYLSSYDGVDTGITFDDIIVNVLKNSRAMLRFYRNTLSLA